MSVIDKHPLRRTVLGTAAAGGGIVLLLALKPHTPPETMTAGADPSAPETAAAPSATASGSPTASAPASASASPTEKHHRAAPSHSAPSRTSAAPTRGTTHAAPAPSSPAPAPTKSTTTTRTVSGSTAQTKYGPVQVQITVSGGRITAAKALQSPNESARCISINSTAVPKLNQETLSAQSASIDTVSGATYTSTGYRTSLQSALDKAGL